MVSIESDEVSETVSINTDTIQEEIPQEKIDVETDEQINEEDSPKLE